MSRADEPGEPLTDEELAARRQARFGELPARIDAGDLVELVDTGHHPYEPPPQDVDPKEWGGAGRMP
jgi:hypothetical protein